MLSMLPGKTPGGWNTTDNEGISWDMTVDYFVFEHKGDCRISVSTYELHVVQSDRRPVILPSLPGFGCFRHNSCHRTTHSTPCCLLTKPMSWIKHISTQLDITTVRMICICVVFDNHIDRILHDIVCGAGSIQIQRRIIEFNCYSFPTVDVRNCGQTKTACANIYGGYFICEARRV